MNKLTFVTGICIIGVCTSGCAETENPPSQTEQVEWGYAEENGPDVWGQLSPDFALCAEGTLQSPIDLVAPAASELSDIMFDYQPSEMNIHNNGHTIEVSPASENRIEVDGVGYQLLQFHFHAPSEHTVAGRTFEMEMHLVHRNGAGTLTVIGVLIEPGDENAAFDSMWAQLPDTPGATNLIENAVIDADDLLPSDRRSYRYDGSLTTPTLFGRSQVDCSGDTHRIIRYANRRVKAIVHDNNRPVQPLNERELLLDVTENGQDG